MTLKSKKEILTERLEMINGWITKLIEEYKTGERDAEDFFSEMDKKQLHMENAVVELEEHDKWLKLIK